MRAVSTPNPLSPARASPESLSRIRLKAIDIFRVQYTALKSNAISINNHDDDEKGKTRAALCADQIRCRIFLKDAGKIDKRLLAILPPGSVLPLPVAELTRSTIVQYRLHIVQNRCPLPVSPGHRVHSQT